MAWGCPWVPLLLGREAAQGHHDKSFSGPTVPELCWDYTGMLDPGNKAGRP